MTALYSPRLGDSFRDISSKLGWESLPASDGGGAWASFPSRLTVEVEGQEPAHASLGFFWRGEGVLATADFAGRDPDPKEIPSALFRRYLDLSVLQRAALWAVGRSLEADYLLCATVETCSLFEVSGEILLGQCGPLPSDEELAACLGALTAERAKQPPLPDPERLGRELSRWLGLFCGTVGPVLKWGRADSERLGRQLLLGVKALLWVNRAGLLPNLARLGMEVLSEGDCLRVVWRPLAPADLADCLLAAAESCAPVGAGAFSALERNALRRQIESLEPGRVPPVADILRLAAVRFRSAIQLPILVPTGQEHAAWKLALIEPLAASEAIEARDLYVFTPLRLDMAECGFGRVLEAVEELAAHALKEKAELARAGGRQLDMIEAAPDPRLEEERLRDPFNWVCRHALRLKVAPAYQEALAYLVASHVLELRTSPAFRDHVFRPLVALKDLFKEVQ